MSTVLALASPHRIKASHRRRGRVASGRFVQRYYDPMLGRFLSPDPVQTDPNSGASFNRYNYANNNPYKFTDPDGRAIQPVYPEAIFIPIVRVLRLIPWLRDLGKQELKQKSNADPVPQKAREVDEFAQKNDGQAIAGHKGGKEFKNDGRAGGEILPKETKSGDPIKYKEYDVHPYEKGVDRGAERVVRGSDGKSYYTQNHYDNFTEIKPSVIKEIVPKVTPLKP